MKSRCLRTRERSHVPLAALVCLALVATLAAPVAAQDFQIVTAGPSSEVKGRAGEKPAGGVYDPRGLVRLPDVPLGQGFVPEVEPNGTAAQATPLGGTNVVAYGNVFAGGDVDFFSFTAAAGDRVYAATQTSFSASASTDSHLRLIASDGTTVLEFDDDNGSFGSLSSTIAGATIPAGGTYYLQVNHDTATGTLRPYHLDFQLRSGVPDPEVEPNDVTPQVLPASGWITGDTSAATDQDFYSIDLAAGDTLFVSLDLDPERDVTTWNGWHGIGVFGSPGLIFVSNDAGTADTIPSEAIMMTVKDAGTYLVFVATQSGAATFGTYHLSVSVHPAQDEGLNCTTYTSTDPAQPIADAGLTSSTITVPGNPRIADVDVSIDLTHTNMADLDVQLVSPAGNDNGIFSDIGSATQTGMNARFDDEAGLPPLFSGQSGMAYQPELNYRLSWLDGEDGGGVWTLALRDDAANASTGTLNGWSVRVCEQAPPPTCGPGTQQVVVYSSDFEADDGGFTHSGTLDEWERGLPSFVPITTCNSGTNCWKTDLDNTYDASSNQDLLSPSIDLTTAGLVGPVVVTWNQRYHIESATFDHYSVDIEETGGANPSRLFEWYGATMNNTIGTPSSTIAESSGWSRMVGQVDGYLGDNIQLRFHLDTDTSVQLAGVAVDDVTVTACEPGVPEIDFIKTVDPATGVCGATNNISVPFGTPVTYCYTMFNTGTVTMNFHTVVDDQLGTLLDNFPFPVDPGNGVFFTVDDVVLGATTTNNATWTASDAPGDSTTCNSAGITIPDSGPGVPYPSQITVAGAPASPTAITVALNNMSHTWPDDIDVLLVGPGGQNLVIESDVGGSTDIVGVDILWDDAAGGLPPDGGPLVTGSYQPSNVGAGDTFNPPAPAGPHNNPAPAGVATLGSIFGGLDPNGTWDLYLMDGFAGDSGSIGEWCVTAAGAGGLSASDSDSATVTLLYPDISVDPTFLSSFQEVDTQVVLPLDIINNGGADLDWDITESLPFGAGRKVLRVPGRQEPILPHTRVPAPPANEVTSGSESFSRAAVEGEGRTVETERGEVPEGTVTITHSASQSIIALNSVSCNAGGLHTDNSYIRRFDLAAFGITSAFDIVSVDVGVEQALGNTGSQPVTVNLYTWDPLDPFTFANFDLIGTTGANVPDQSLTVITIPVAATAPANSTLVVELFTPNGQGPTNNSFFVGSNNLGQTDPTFLAAADCGVAEPTDTAILGFPGMHMVMNLTGQVGCGDDLTWVSVDPTSGTTLPAATDTVDVTFDSTGLALGGIYTGALCVNSNDPGTPTVQVPLTLEVDTMPFLDGFETGDTSRWTFTIP